MINVGQTIGAKKMATYKAIRYVQNTAHQEILSLVIDQTEHTLEIKGNTTPNTTALSMGGQTPTAAAANEILRQVAEIDLDTPPTKEQREASAEIIRAVMSDARMICLYETDVDTVAQECLLRRQITTAMPLRAVEHAAVGIIEKERQRYDVGEVLMPGLVKALIRAQDKARKAEAAADLDKIMRHPRPDQAMRLMLGTERQKAEILAAAGAWCADDMLHVITAGAGPAVAELAHLIGLTDQVAKMNRGRREAKPTLTGASLAEIREGVEFSLGSACTMQALVAIAHGANTIDVMDICGPLDATDKHVINSAGAYHNAARDTAHVMKVKCYREEKNPRENMQQQHEEAAATADTAWQRWYKTAMIHPASQEIMAAATDALDMHAAQAARDATAFKAMGRAARGDTSDQPYTGDHAAEIARIRRLHDLHRQVIDEGRYRCGDEGEHERSHGPEMREASEHLTYLGESAHLPWEVLLDLKGLMPCATYDPDDEDDEN